MRIPIGQFVRIKNNDKTLMSFVGYTGEIVRYVPGDEHMYYVRIWINQDAPTTVVLSDSDFEIVVPVEKGE